MVDGLAFVGILILICIGGGLGLLFVMFPKTFIDRKDWKVARVDGRGVDWSRVDAAKFAVFVLVKLFLCILILEVLYLFVLRALGA